MYSYEVWRAPLEKLELELLSAITSSKSYSSLMFSKFPMCAINPQTHTKDEPVLNPLCTILAIHTTYILISLLA